ncbi:carboxypeptidase M32 [Candidatus Saccharibacteria bacterium]|nr:carboxypeptidase M32 [Candidatus Saccharibacteria bacterium]
MNGVNELIDQLKDLAKLGAAAGLLGWDEEVNLPPKAHANRGEVNAFLAAELHNRFTSDNLYKLLNGLSEPSVFEKLSDDQKIIVRETKRDVDLAKKLPNKFVEEMARLTSKAFSSWAEARKKSDFSIFEPVLTEIVDKKRQEAELLGYKVSAYDALLDEYEPDMTTVELDKVFNPLADELAKLIATVSGKKTPSLPAVDYPLERQKGLNTEIAVALGYDLEAGRIDISPHPFSTSFHPTDARITTRYDKDDFWVSLGSTIHEVGHALYEQGLPAEEWGTPLGESVSLGIHESQSRTWENFVGRSRPFVDFLYPRMEKYFGKLPYSPEELFLWLNKVKPVPIRVESDEVTYNLHIVIRYQLEKALIEGQMNVADLPTAWNEKMKHYLGLDIKNDADGVLQDIHWSHGSLGYFPTYTLGNLNAAQFFESAKKANPGLEAGFSKGEFKPLLGWLRENIHKEGRRYNSEELVKKVTGKELDASFLLKHLERKIELYQN